MNGFEIMLVWAIYCCPVPLYVMNGEDSIGTAPIANGLIYSEKESYTKFKLSEYLEEFELHSLKSHIMALKNHQNSFEEIKKCE